MIFDLSHKVLGRDIGAGLAVRILPADGAIWPGGNYIENPCPSPRSDMFGLSRRDTALARAKTANKATRSS